jgi:hypothetical protein
MVSGEDVRAGEQIDGHTAVANTVIPNDDSSDPIESDDYSAGHIAALKGNDSFYNNYASRHTDEVSSVMWEFKKAGIANAVKALKTMPIKTVLRAGRMADLIDYGEENIIDFLDNHPAYDKLLVFIQGNDPNDMAELGVTHGWPEASCFLTGWFEVMGMARNRLLMYRNLGEHEFLQHQSGWDDCAAEYERDSGMSGDDIPF